MRNLVLAPGQAVLLEPEAAWLRLRGHPPERQGKRPGMISRAMQMIGIGGDGDDEPEPPAIAPGALHCGGWWLAGEIAIIAVRGVLTQDGCFDFWDGVCPGYLALLDAVAAARADDRVAAVLIRIDSPGGLVFGCFDAAEALAAGANGKPTWALVSGQCCSAAYAIACGTDRIVAPAEAMVGSIGAYMLHTDESGLLAEIGVKVTAIESAPMKTMGAEYKPLSPEAAAAMQSSVDDDNRRFQAWVASRRPMTAEAIAGLAGAWVKAENKLDAGRSGLVLGLVDAIARESDVLAMLRASLTVEGAPASPPPAEETEMTKTMAEVMAELQTKAEGGDKDAEATVAKIRAVLDGEPPPEDEEDKPMETDATAAEAKATGAGAALALLRHGEAKARPKLADTLAQQVEAKALAYGPAMKILAAAPKEAKGGLGEAMNGRDQNPGADGAGHKPGSRGASLVAAAQALAKTSMRAA